MKIFFLCAFLVSTSVSAAAADFTLEQAVARSIQALLGDTVNEGFANAQVIYEGDTPAVSCKVSNVKGNPVKKWAFCRVDFRVTFEGLEDVVERQCDLLYSFEPSQIKKSVRRENEDLIAACMENLSEGP